MKVWDRITSRYARSGWFVRTDRPAAEGEVTGSRVIGVLVTIALAAGVPFPASAEPGFWQSPGATNPAPAAAHPARVRVKLEGFDLTPPPAKGSQAGVAAANGTPRHAGANQIGGASRGIGSVRLFAPETALAYSLHPTLQWSGTPDTKYKLELEDLTAHTIYEVTVDGTTFSYPEDAPALKPGASYSWKVEPEIDMMGTGSETATIVMAGDPQRQQIEAALAAITQKDFAGDRARAQVYFDKRVWYDAAAAYSILISSHPDNRELHKMRGALYDQAPATEKLADEDFTMAK